MRWRRQPLAPIWWVPYTGLDKVAVVEVEQIANIGSYDMTPDIWRRLSTRANELLARDGVSGIVVTHGTDTLEETAYFLNLTITSESLSSLWGRSGRLPISTATGRVIY